MPNLIFELFSGVGFCNQLFSFETAIYLANISKRKLILVIRNPLCHCGRSSWDYGGFVELFSSDYQQYLENGIEVYMGNNVSKMSEIQSIINDTTKTQKISFGRKLSHMVLIDKEIFENVYKNNLSDPGIVKFLHNRSPHIFDVKSWKHENVYMMDSNASRCFYNFITSEKNYSLMSRICLSLTKLKPEFYEALKLLDIPESFMSFHFRFGDVRHDKDSIDKTAEGKYENINVLIKKHMTNVKNILIMSDRSDAKIVENLKKENYHIIFTEDMVENIPEVDLKKLFSKIKNMNVVKFLIQKLICEKSNIFVGYLSSTVSHHIQYTNFVNNKPYIYYVETETKLSTNSEPDWVANNVFGPSIAFKQFFRNNVKNNLHMVNTKLITLTNDGYLELTENLLLSMKKIGIEQILKIYCIGEKCFKYLQEKFPNNEIVKIDTQNNKLNDWIEYKAGQSTDNEGKKLWANITSYKMFVINEELLKGNDIIFTDGDIVFEKNPFTYILEQLDDKIELLVQNDEQMGQKENMCTGFFWLKSNPNTIKITDFKSITDNIDSFRNDQQYMRCYANKMNHKYLPLDLFPNGKHYRDKKPESPYIIHFNYDVSQHKIRRMKIFNKWYIDSKNEINPINDNNLYIDKHPITKYLTAKNISLRQGTICNVKETEEFMFQFLKEWKLEIKSILEIGFLAGHSADLFLKTLPQSHVTSIEEGKLQSVNAGKEYIDLIHPGRHTLIKGSSSEQLLNLDKSFDLIFIDGSFKEEDVYQDVILCQKYMHKDTILIINNVIQQKSLTKYWNAGPTSVWRKITNNKSFESIVQKDFGKGIGIAISRKMNK